LIEKLADGFNEPVFAAMRGEGRGKMLQRNQRLVKRFLHGLAVAQSTAGTDFT